MWECPSDSELPEATSRAAGGVTGQPQTVPASCLWALSSQSQSPLWATVASPSCTILTADAGTAASESSLEIQPQAWPSPVESEAAF